MCAKHITYIPFTENLLDAVLQGESSRRENALYIFPTEASRQAGIRAYQPKWMFENNRFLTMEELKQHLFVTERPVLKEERRTLAFYAALSPADKRFFKINNYFQSIEAAQNFFDLWEEFNEEMIPRDLYGDRLENSGAELLPWQKDMWDRFVGIKSAYSDYIRTKGYDDVIFTRQPQRMNMTGIADFACVHFVNQFYFTRLEKQIIDTLEREGKDVWLYYGLPRELVDEEHLTIAPFSLKELGPGRTQRIDIVECKSDFSMLRAMIGAVDRLQIRHVVNFSELRNPHARLLSPQRFNVGGSAPFTETSLYRFFQAAYSLLEALVFEPERSKLLLPLNAVLDALLNDAFAAALFADSPDAHAVVPDYIYGLLDYDYRFVDLDGDLFSSVRSGDGVGHLRRLLVFVERLLDINSISDVVNFIDSSAGVNVDDVLTEDEKKLCDAREAFYRALADFYSLENMGLVDDWSAMFENPRLAPAARTAAGILRLFLDYLKPRSIRFHLAPTETPRVDFTSLQNTRNLNYQKVIIANVVEKEIPHARQTPFLFTERQRKALGLKIYDDVKLREKYYLHRLVLTTPHVVLLTQKNIEQNIDVSSFVEEIRLYAAAPQMNDVVYRVEDYADAYAQFLNSCSEYRVDTKRATVADFYMIETDRERDFSDAQLNLSYYSLSGMLSNAFTFYIKTITRLQEKTKEADADFSAKLIGNILHDGLNAVWRDILQQQGLPPVQIDFSAISDELIARALNRTPAGDRFYYAMPHNYADIYFREILLPRAAAGVRRFFSYLDRIGVSNKPLNIYPEKDEPMLRDAYMPFFTLDNLKVNIGGRADLRIEAADAAQFLIFDYKTGGMKKEQLILYELYYYRLEKTAAPASVQSYFYQILDAEGKELGEYGRRLKKEELIDQFTDQVKGAVRELLQTGFKLPKQKAALADMQEITRADLYSSKYLPQINQRGLM